MFRALRYTLVNSFGKMGEGSCSGLLPSLNCLVNSFFGLYSNNFCFGGKMTLVWMMKRLWFWWQNDVGLDDERTLVLVAKQR